MGPDQIEMRNFILSLLDLRGDRAVLDIGCGTGYDLLRMGQQLGDGSTLIGIDGMESAISAAHEEIGDDPRFSLLVADVSKGLPLDDHSFDVVYSKDLLECVTDKDSIIREIHRVLKPGGQVFFVHWDWDSQIINGSDKPLIRKIIHEFADWKQKWMDDSDGWMGRRLWGIFNRSGLFDGSVHTYVLQNTQFAAPYAGYANIHNFGALVSQEKITADEYAAFLQDISETVARGEYFFSITCFIYAGYK